VTVRVLYIGGLGRSGTTLLNRMLGELPDVCAIGEAVNLWQQGVVNNEKCGCGERFHSCSFWRDVGALAFGDWHRVDLTSVLALRSARFRFVREASVAPESVTTSLTPGARRGIEANNDLYRRLYSAISQVSGCSVVVDASKHASLLSYLRHGKQLDLRLIHMVRDSRGVAHSFAKIRQRPESDDPGSVMDRFSPVRSAMLWNIYNTSFFALRRLGVPYHRLRYEDLVRTPERHLREIAGTAGIGVDEDAFSFLGDGYVRLTTTHCVAGNPMRFEHGRMSVRMDDEWTSGLSGRDRLTVTGLTLPLLIQFGYLPSGVRR
jgi:Sulfotransferase domain